MKRLNLFSLKTKGSKCWYVNHQYNSETIQKELTVTAIRNDYIYCVGVYPNEKYKFEIKDGREIVEYGCGGKLYPSKLFYQEEIQISELKNLIKTTLPDDLIVLEKIKSIIDTHNEDHETVENL